LAKSSQIGPAVNIDITLHGPNNTSLEQPAALILFTSTGELYKQGTTQTSHHRWTDLPPMQYRIQVVVPGFERAIQQIDARRAGDVNVSVSLRPQTGTDKSFPPVSDDPRVNQVFGVYASRSGDWTMATSYWTKALVLDPNYVPAIVSMGEALLNENQISEARVYLDRAAKIDPTYWRTEAILAEVAWRTGATDEAVIHAQRALELGHDEAVSVSPLLARALVAQASEVLRGYLKKHPDDLAARKQFDAWNNSSGPSSSGELNNDVAVREPAAAAAHRAVPSTRPSWLPPDVDDDVSPVESPLTCNLEEVLQKAGQRVQEFVSDVQRFTAAESLLHESLNKSGKVSERQTKKYDYMVSIEEMQPGILGVDEYLGSGPAPADSLGGVTSKGLPALVLIFHPYYSGDFSMRCEGLATWKGARVWQVSFRQREDKPNRIRSYRTGWNSPPHPVALKGRAWFLEDSYQIAGLETDLIAPLPDLRLTVDHTSIEYGPVHFSSRSLDMWVPHSAEVFSDLKGKRIHQRMDFSNYLLFSVDDTQKISSPKTIPEAPQFR
jgi:tetratricopeptide (TPR) repeat protein